MPGMALGDAFRRVMGGSGGEIGPGIGGGGMEPEVRPRTPVDKNPMSQDGETLFVDPALFSSEKEPKKGDKVLIRATVLSIGSKIALTPSEVSDINGQEQEMEG